MRSRPAFDKPYAPHQRKGAGAVRCERRGAHGAWAI